MAGSGETDLARIGAPIGHEVDARPTTEAVSVDQLSVLAMIAVVSRTAQIKRPGSLSMRTSQTCVVRPIRSGRAVATK